MKQWMKKGLAACLALVMCLSLAACGGDQEEETPAEDPVTVRVAALKGPTAMGMVKLMSDSDAAAESGEETTGNTYDFTLAASADEVSPKLMQGELDIACVPANLASVLYNRTDGGIVTLAVNTLGVLYIVENGNSVQSMADLAGRTIAASGKGSTPEYALRYLLSENGIDPDTGVTIDWKSEHSECVAALASGAATIAMLPQPFVTVAQTQLPDLRVALDLTEEWDALDNGSALLTGVVVARADFVEEHPAAVEEFLTSYAESVEWVNANTAEAAELIGGYDIVDAAVAEKALPYCNIVCITGSEMKDMLSGYLQVLFDAAPASVGQDAETGEGGLPGDDFYYGA
nr:ABC transporter substrate-binding protein [Oscillibacter valericigenes]